MESTSFDVFQYKGMPGKYLVTLQFTARGLSRSKTYVVETSEHTLPYNLAIGQLEDDLIEEGFSTFECGCCINDDVETTGYRVTPIKREP